MLISYSTGVFFTQDCWYSRTSPVPGGASRTLGIGRAGTRLGPNLPFALQPLLWKKNVRLDKPLKEEQSFVFHPGHLSNQSVFPLKTERFRKTPEEK